MGNCCSRKRSSQQSEPLNKKRAISASSVSIPVPSKSANNVEDNKQLQINIDYNSPVTPAPGIVMEYIPQTPINEKLSPLPELKQNDSPLPQAMLIQNYSEGIPTSLATNTPTPIIHRQHTFLLLDAAKEQCNYQLLFEKQRDVTKTIFKIQSFAHSRRISQLDRKPKDAKVINNNIVQYPLDYRLEEQSRASIYWWAIFMFKRKGFSRGYFKILDHEDLDDVYVAEGDIMPQLKISKEHLDVFLNFVHHPKVREYLSIRDGEMWDRYDITIYIDKQQYTLQFFNGKDIHQCQAFSIVKNPEATNHELTPKDDEKYNQMVVKQTAHKPKKIHALYFPQAINAIQWMWFDANTARFVRYDDDDLQNLEFDASYYANIQSNFPISNTLYRSNRNTSIFDHCYLPRFSSLMSKLNDRQKYCMRYSLHPTNESDAYELNMDQLRLKSNFARTVQRYFDRNQYLRNIAQRADTFRRVLTQNVDAAGFMVTSLRRDTYIEDVMDENAPTNIEGTHTTSRHDANQLYTQNVAWIAAYDSTLDPNEYHIVLTSNFNKKRTSNFSVKMMKDEHMEFITVNIKEAELVKNQYGNSHIWTRFKNQRNRYCRSTFGYWDVSFHADEEWKLLRQHLDAILSTLQQSEVAHHFHLLPKDPDYLWNDDEEDAKDDEKAAFQPKKLACHGSDWEIMYGIKHGTAISISHLLSVQFYCSFVEAASYFVDTFRKIDEKESDQEIKLRHKKCALWSKYLRESVEAFGVKIRKRSKNTNQNMYYHGITNKFLFTNTFLSFHLPLSTTIDEQMIEHLVDKRGMVLALGSRWVQIIRVWDCLKFSDFPWEAEHLFVGGLEPLMVYDIKERGFDGMKGETYLSWIQAMNNIHQIFEGMACKFDTDPLYIKQLMDNRLGVYKDHRPDKYMSELFDTYCKDIKEVTMRLSLMDQSYKKIVDNFMDGDKLDLLKIIKLFPNCKRITLCDGHKYQLVPRDAVYNDTVLKTIEDCMEWLWNQKNYTLNRIVLQTAEPIYIELWKMYKDTLTADKGWECRESKQNEEDDDDDENIDCEYHIYRSRKSIAATKHGDECESVGRIWEVLEHYEEHEDNIDATLVQYCSTHLLLDDWIHIIAEHHDDLLPQTQHDIRQCAIAERHYLNQLMDEEEEQKYQQDGEFIFYRDLLDTIHCYLHHSQDSGEIFTKTKSFHHMDTKGLNVDESDDDHSKYNLKLNKKAPQDFTMDAIPNMIMQLHIEEEEKHNVLSLLSDEDYDTEAIKEDVVDQTQSNIIKESSVCGTAIQNLIKQHAAQQAAHAFTFSVGYRFYYMHWLKNDTSAQITTPEDPHADGLKPICIQAKYTSLKQEVLQDLDARTFNKLLTKCNKYYASKQVKVLQCAVDECGYGFKKGDNIKSEHLLALILYSDCSKLQKRFSTSFHKRDCLESMESVIIRHSNFAIWARLLREVVDIFGKDALDCYEGEDGTTIFPAKGPFYCGMSHIMVMPQFNISLFAPTSTTKVESIAREFAGDNGMIIELNNNGENGNVHLKVFSCAWFSAYPRESEWLFIGGRYKMQIQNVIRIKYLHLDKLKFGRLFRVFFYFDCMLNGSEMDFDGINIKKMRLKPKDRKSLMQFVQHQLEIDDIAGKYDKYVCDTFKAFTLHKKEIILRMHQIKKHFNSLSDLILYSVKNTAMQAAISEDNQNIPKPTLFKLFPNIEQITIHASYNDENSKQKQYYEYGFDLLSLLDVLSKYISLFTKNNLNIAIKATSRTGAPWTSNQWMLASHATVEWQFIQSEFANKGLRIETSKGMNAQYNLLITKEP